MAFSAFIARSRQHLDDAGGSYGQHLVFTLHTAGYLLVTAAGIVVHGLLPGLLTDVGSRRINALQQCFQKRSMQKFHGKEAAYD